MLTGTPVVAGLAFGPVVVMSTGIPAQAIERFRATAAPTDPMAAYDAAVTAVATGYEARAARRSGSAAEVLAATSALARDPGLRDAVAENVSSGADLLAAVSSATTQFAELFTAMGGLMAERAVDLRDIERRVTANLVGAPAPGLPTPAEPSVLVADDLAPADTAELDPAVIVALVTERGGPTSHTAIIARQLGIPCVVGVAGALTLAGGAAALVDGDAGTVTLPTDAAAARELVETDRARRAALLEWDGPAQTTDGSHVELLANVADGRSAVGASAVPVEGVGLFRTELCFLDRTEEPSVAEQAETYVAVLERFAGTGQHVVVRTLDAGSDKPIAFATRADEENPALGVRGLRLSFDNPGLMERQLDAIALAAQRTGAETWVMAPMVATVAEAASFAELVRARGLRPGVMVEIPSAALLSRQLLEVVDFLSIGTNDLTQYTMAADRLATDLAHLTDPWQPAVLQLIAMTAAAGQAAGKPIGVCGEAAADPALACVLVGLGVTSLSMAPSAVRAVGARLSGISRGACEAAARAALSAASPAQARDAARAELG